MRAPLLETLAILTGAGLLLAAVPLDSVAGSLFALLGLALGVAGTATWWLTRAPRGEKRWEAFAVRAGLHWDGQQMHGTWRGRPVSVHLIGRRVELRTTLDQALEPIFPVTVEGLRAHLASVEAGCALPVPSLRKARSRLALREAMAAGVPLRGFSDQLMATLDRGALDEARLEAALDALTRTAQALHAPVQPAFWQQAA